MQPSTRSSLPRDAKKKPVEYIESEKVVVAKSSTKRGSSRLLKVALKPNANEKSSLRKSKVPERSNDKLVDSAKPKVIRTKKNTRYEGVVKISDVIESGGPIKSQQLDTPDPYEFDEPNVEDTQPKRVNRQRSTKRTVSSARDELAKDPINKNNRSNRAVRKMTIKDSKTRFDSRADNSTEPEIEGDERTGRDLPSQVENAEDSLLSKEKKGSNSQTSRKTGNSKRQNRPTSMHHTETLTSTTRKFPAPQQESDIIQIGSPALSEVSVKSSVSQVAPIDVAKSKDLVKQTRDSQPKRDKSSPLDLMMTSDSNPHHKSTDTTLDLQPGGYWVSVSNIKINKEKMVRLKGNTLGELQESYRIEGKYKFYFRSEEGTETFNLIDEPNAKIPYTVGPDGQKRSLCLVRQAD